MKWYDPLKATGPFGWVSWLISAFNKNDKTFSKIGDGLGSIFNKYTGAGPTGADVYANSFSAEEAQKARDWEEEMSNTAFQRQVADMQKAGLNPALMYGGAGSSGASTPSSPSPSSVAPQSQGIGDIIGAVMDIALLKAQIQNINADTRGKEASAIGQEITNTNLDAQMKATIQSTLAGTDSVRAETLYRNLLIQYGMPEAEVNKVLKDIQIGDSSITRNNAEAELAKVNAAYTEVKKKLDLDKLPYELAKMSAEAKESLARSIVEEYRGYYMHTYGVDVPNGAVASFVGLLTNTFSGADMIPSGSGFNELSVRTLFPFIDMILNAFGK